MAWQAHFVKNMFIRPTEEELKPSNPIRNVDGIQNVNSKWKEQGLNSEVYVAFNISDKMAVVGGTWYGGEIKKGFFSIMNYYLPLEGMAAMHCSANQGKTETPPCFSVCREQAKPPSRPTRPSAHRRRRTRMDEDGVFNFEGGCYAKCIHLSKEQERISTPPLKEMLYWKM